MMENQAETPARSLRSLFGTLLALLFLTGVSIAVSRVDAGPFRVLVALAVASVKTGLVLFIFMHIGRAGKAVALSFLATVLTLAVFMALTFLDILYR